MAMINSINFGNDTHSFTLPYGVCSTAADVVAKTVTVDNFSLETGAIVIVKFTNANSVNSPTLNVNNTGAKPLYLYYNTPMSSSTSSGSWKAGAVLLLVYDGTNWVKDYWYNSTYTPAGLGGGYGTCSTAAATTAKVVSLSHYALTEGGIVAVKFTYDVPAGATMNINSKGAKAIYYQGAAITDGIIKAGDTATFVYSTCYHLIALDRDIQSNLIITDDGEGNVEFEMGTDTTTTFQADWNQNDSSAPNYIKNKPQLDSMVTDEEFVGHKHTKSEITDFPTSMPASDVSSWAKAASKPTYTASEVGAVPTSRTVNGKALSSNITLAASDIGAIPKPSTAAGGDVLTYDEASSSWVASAPSGGDGEPELMRGPILITETQTVDLSVWGIEVGDPINVICVGGGGGGGANQGAEATGTPSSGFGAGKQGAPSSYYSSKYHAAGGGGGSGYVTYKSIIVDKLSVAVTIGAEGENGKYHTTPVESWTPGKAGGTTSFGNYLSAAGGNGGGGGTNTSANSSSTISGAKGGAGGNHGQQGTTGAGSGRVGGVGGEGFVPKEPFCVDSSGMSGIHIASGCVMIWY